MRCRYICVLIALIMTLPVGTSAQAGAFGNAVVIADGELIVAEPNNNFRPGTVYVYRRDAGAWREAAQLRAPDAQRADGFGTALAVSGSALFVAQRDGRLHAFRKQNGNWISAGLVPLERGTQNRAVGAIAADGDWLLVGSPGAAGGGRGGAGGGGSAEPGTVYVLHRSASGAWTQQAQLTPDDGMAGDRFGATIAISNGRALIGAPGSSQLLAAPRAGGRPGGAAPATPAEPVTIEGAGRVYEFRLANGAWQAAGALDARPVLNQNFGTALALTGDLAVIGAPGDADGHGAAFVFRRNAETGAWTEATRLVAFSGVRGDAFGTSVAIDGADVWVGSPVNRGIEPGLAYVFRGRADERLLGAPRRLDVGEQTPTDNFGERITAANGVAAVVAAGMHRNAGAVYVYERDATGEWQRNAMLVSPPDVLPAIVGQERRCTNGKVELFDCRDVELLAFIPNSMLTAPDRARGIRLNDNWGWTDPETGREYALIGRTDGTSFVDITDPTNPVLVGDMPQPTGSPPSPTWRDIKVYRDHAYVVADAAGAHGVQVFDLTRLRNVADKPALFEPDTRYTGINSAHNIVINEETGFAYSVGSSGGGQTCAGGLHMIDIREPKNPKFAGCFAHDGTGRAGRGYTHDAQCVVYRGPDNRYSGREICLGLNENAVSIADVTDKQNPKSLSSARYPNPAYTHQGWLSEDHRFFYVDDESDLLAGSVPTTRTTVWDLTDLEDPVLVKEFMGSMPASAHNQYVRGNLVFQANYRYGLHVLDISDPANPREVGFFDTAPYLEGPGFSGAWSNYPFFKSGTVIVTSVQEGLFVLKKRTEVY
ncbi:MAG TPA: choice-of-anchor B family protein [Longimicrobiales bacterium]|nr:choice-of-anchor B family protein [Longimicrobiales bacterium]